MAFRSTACQLHGTNSGRLRQPKAAPTKTATRRTSVPNGRTSVLVFERVLDLLELRLVHSKRAPEFFGILEVSSFGARLQNTRDKIRLEVRQLFQVLASG